MRIKKFLGDNIKDATEQMKRELGTEAIVLHTRRVPKNNLLKSLGKEQFEITGAIDDPTDPAAQEQQLPNSTYSRRNVKQSYDAVMKNAERQQMPQEEPSSTLEGLQQMSRSFERTQESAPEPRSKSLREASDIVQLKAEVEDMKNILQQLTHQLKFKHFGELPDVLKEAYLNLLQQDVEEKFAVAITNSVLHRITPEQTVNRTTIEQMIIQTISSDFPAAVTERPAKKTKVVVLVGPTGVGKTTTIAKMAAIEKLANGRSVGLISCDTYRIGAIEQLKTFAVIADIPMQVVYRATDLAAAVRKFQRYDVIYIDTVGRSQKAKKDLAELKKIVQAAKADEVHLVLSAQTNYATLRDITEKFSALDPTHLIFSKMDEAVIFGPLYNIIQKTRIPVSFFATGQVVPDDISVSDGMTFARMLYQGIPANA